MDTLPTSLPLTTPDHPVERFTWVALMRPDGLLSLPGPTEAGARDATRQYLTRFYDTHPDRTKGQGTATATERALSLYETGSLVGGSGRSEATAFGTYILTTGLRGHEALRRWRMSFRRPAGQCPLQDPLRGELSRLEAQVGTLP